MPSERGTGFGAEYPADLHGTHKMRIEFGGEECSFGRPSFGFYANLQESGPKRFPESNSWHMFGFLIPGLVSHGFHRSLAHLCGMSLEENQ